uniref:Uncharacterized protein n=1 Tax=Lutzomyia longipalpis TaxID=7200 RepID=A0A1B0CKE7_LUTLO
MSILSASFFCSDSFSSCSLFCLLLQQFLLCITLLLLLLIIQELPVPLALLLLPLDILFIVIHLIIRCIILLGILITIFGGIYLKHPLLQLPLELSNLLLEMPQKCILRLIIDMRTILNILSPSCISQRRNSLHVVTISWTNTRTHHRLGIPTKGVLQQSRQFGISIRNVRTLPINKGTYHISQNRQRQVYLGGLLETHPSGLGLILTLRALQREALINESQILMRSFQVEYCSEFDATFEFLLAPKTPVNIRFCDRPLNFSLKSITTESGSRPPGIIPPDNCSFTALKSVTRITFVCPESPILTECLAANISPTMTTWSEISASI